MGDEAEMSGDVLVHLPRVVYLPTPSSSFQDSLGSTMRDDSCNNDRMSVAYGNGVFVAVASSGSDNRVMTGTA